MERWIEVDDQLMFIRVIASIKKPGNENMPLPKESYARHTTREDDEWRDTVAPKMIARAMHELHLTEEEEAGNEDLRMYVVPECGRRVAV